MELHESTAEGAARYVPHVNEVSACVGAWHALLQMRKLFVKHGCQLPGMAQPQAVCGVHNIWLAYGFAVIHVSVLLFSFVLTLTRVPQQAGCLRWLGSRQPPVLSPASAGVAVIGWHMQQAAGTLLGHKYACVMNQAILVVGCLKACT